MKHRVVSGYAAAVVVCIAAVISFAVGMGVMYSSKLPGAYIEGLSDGVEMTDRQWLLHLRTHCICWFDDSRCKVDRPIVVCKLPEPLKKGKDTNGT